MGTPVLLVYDPLVALTADASAFSEIVKDGTNIIRNILNKVPSNIWSSASPERQELIKNTVKYLNLQYLQAKSIIPSYATDILNAVGYSVNNVNNEKITSEISEKQFKSFLTGLKARNILNILGYGGSPFPLRLNQVPSEDSSIPAPEYNAGSTRNNPFYSYEYGKSIVVFPYFLGLNHNIDVESPDGWDPSVKGDYADLMIGASYSSMVIQPYSYPAARPMRVYSPAYMRNQVGNNFSYKGSDPEMFMQYYYEKVLPEFAHDYVITARKYFGNPANEVMSGDYKCWILSAKELGQTVHTTNGYGIGENEWNKTEKYYCFPTAGGSTYVNTMAVVNYQGSNDYMWTRTARPYSNWQGQTYTVFLVVGHSSGVWSSSDSNGSYGVAPGLRVGITSKDKSLI